MSAVSSRWYAVLTQARSEAKALHNLHRQGYEAYLPQFLRIRRHARRVDRVPAPLFPRYLFVRMDPERTQWRPIRSTFGVVDIVCHRGGPVPVPKGVVEDIREREADDGYIVLRSPSEFTRGEPVRVVAGALADCIGLFDCVCDEDRVALLLDMLGRAVRIEVPFADVASSS